MKNLIVLLTMLLVGLGTEAQNARKEIKENILRSAGCYLAYPGPEQEALSPTPEGYIPFYISHYGRHGSRFLIGKQAYTGALATLEEADKAGKLTAKGKEVLAKVALVTKAANGRDGELSLLGAQQHQQIATRMYRNFPEIFAGKVHIKANSTTVIRCILSMENALQALLKLNPELQISHDASYADMYYMNMKDKKLDSLSKSRGADKAYEAFCKRHDRHEHTMKLLFNDKNYWQKELDATKLSRRLFSIASNMQSLELRKEIDLFDIFDEEEIYHHWMQDNAEWYLYGGPNKLTDGKRPYKQRNLLRRIIEEADSCIAFDHPGATLRYGHDSMVYPLTCLLGINGLDTPVSDLEALGDSGFLDYKIVPMAANLQFVFYRNKADRNDILVKVLENENEVSLPLHTDRAPYYHWQDFKAYYLKKLAAYQE